MLYFRNILIFISGLVATLAIILAAAQPASAASPCVVIHSDKEAVYFENCGTDRPNYEDTYKLSSTDGKVYSGVTGRNVSYRFDATTGAIKINGHDRGTVPIEEDKRIAAQEEARKKTEEAARRSAEDKAIIDALGPKLKSLETKFQTTCSDASSPGNPQQSIDRFNECRTKEWNAHVSKCFTQSANLEEDQTRGTAAQTEANHKAKFANCLVTKLTGVSVEMVTNQLADTNMANLYQTVNNAGNNAVAAIPKPGVEACSEDDEECEPQSTCNVDGIGWFVCPVMNALAGMLDTAFEFLAGNFLEARSDTVDNPSVRNAWGVMRSLANIAFVIVFMIIIYSQLTSTGISNYGVKRMLPRLIIAAILVNVSFIVCQLAVDLSNLLGYSMKNLFDSLLITASGEADDASALQQFGKGVTYAGLVATALIAGVGLLLALSLPVVVAGLLAILMIVLILVGRQALIVLLTIISPLAFVAFLLPNTEKWFKKWYQMFFALLMVFPIIGVVFGASSLTASVLNSTAIESGDNIMQLVALGVATIPFFVVPGLLKGSLNAAGALGQKLSGLSSKANARVAAGGKKNLGRRAQFLESKMANNGMNGKLGKAMRFAGGYRRRQAFKRSNTESETARAQEEALNKHIAANPGKFGDRQVAGAMAAVDKRDQQEVAEQLTLFKNTNGATDTAGAAAAMNQAIKDGDSVKARAMQQYLAGAGGAGVKKLEEVYSNNSDAIRGNSSLQQSLASDALGLGMKGRSAAIDSFSTDSKGRSFDTIQQDGGTYSRLGTSELAGQKNLEQLMKDGLVSQSMAQSVMGDNAARGTMSLEDRKTMAAIAGTDINGSSLSAGGTQPVPTPSDTPQDMALQSDNTNPETMTNEQAHRAHDRGAMTAKEVNRVIMRNFGPRSSSDLSIPHNSSPSSQQTPNGATSDYHDRMSK